MATFHFNAEDLHNSDKIDLRIVSSLIWGASQSQYGYDAFECLYYCRHYSEKEGQERNYG